MILTPKFQNLKFTEVQQEASAIPKFTKDLEDQEAIDGSTVTFECGVTGKPEPKIQWYKDGKVIKNTVDFKQTYDGTTAKLVLAEILPEDSGEYECVATNQAGEDYVIAKLTVTGEYSIV